MKDPRGHHTQNAYDAATSNLTSTKVTATLDGPALTETTFTYWPDGNVKTQTVVVDDVSHTTAYEYDSSGNLKKETDPLGHVTEHTYDRNGNRLTQTTTRTTYACTPACAPSGTETLTTTHEYDRMGRLTKTTDPDDTFTRTVYDPMGRQKETYDKRARKTTFDYDEMGRLTKTTYPDLTFDESTYDPEGRRLTLRDRRQKTTTYAYDALGRLTQTTFPDTTFTHNTYDPAGRLSELLDARGKTTTYAYDDAGRRTSVRVPLGGGRIAETLFGYDPAGNQTSFRDPNGQTTAFIYDELNRRTRTVFPDTTFTETTYDSLGRRRAERDPAGKITRFDYDKLGRLTKVTDARNKETTYAYDELGNRLSQTDAKAHTTFFLYDKLGRETARVLPDGKQETKAYDDAGNLQTRTDFLGRPTTYAYDDLNRLLSRTYSDSAQNVAFTYTPSGRRETTTDSRGTTTYAYDDRDRLQTLTYPDGRKLEYLWDGNGNRTSLKATLGSRILTTTYTYDDANRLDLVTDPLSRTYDHGYDDNGNRTSLTQPNGTQTAYGYDTLNRLRTLTTTHPPSGRTIQGYTFTVSPAGNRERIDEQDGTVRAYAYDDLYRLTGETVTIAGLSQYGKAFTYDDVGNRLTQTTTLGPAGTPGGPLPPGTLTYGYDTRDRLLTETRNASPPTGYAYDDNGNLTTKDAEATYTWDRESRLVRVNKTDGTLVEHAYDADGNRVRTTTTPAGGTATTTHFLVDTSGTLSHVVAETDASATLKAYYVRGDDLLAIMRPTGPSTWQTRHHHADGIGSIRRLTDEAAIVTDAYTYTAFGERIAHTGSDPQPYAFTGEPYDPNVGFQYHRARWMDPKVGTFAAMDPFQGSALDPTSLHRYAYARLNPISNSDPSGEESLATTTTASVSKATIAAIALVSTIAVACAVNLQLTGASPFDPDNTVCGDKRPGGKEEEVTVFRGLGGTSPSEFKRIDPDGLSTFEILLPNPRYRFVLPFRIKFFPPKRPNLTVGKIIFPPFGVWGSAAYTPALGDPTIGIEHWSLKFGTSNAELPEFLSKLAKNYKQPFP